MAASEQKNSGSLHYYFRTKDALNQMEAEGGPRNLRQDLEALVFPSINLGEANGDEDTYLRFISLLALQNRALLNEVLEGDLNTGYQRCLVHIRRLVTAVPAAVLEQRLVFMSIALHVILAAREASLERTETTHAFWSADGTLANLLTALEGMLCAASNP